MSILDLTTVRSGSLGDVVHSRNPHGSYTRARTVPADPDTLRQQRVRGRMGAVSEAWGQTLDVTQRQSWTDYANRVTLLNRIGEHRHLSGQQMFQRCNAGRTRPFMGIIEDAPTGNSLGAFSLPEVETIQFVDLILVLYGETDEWIRDDGAFFQCYVSDGQSIGTNFYAGPFRFAGATPGNSAVPPIGGDTYFDPYVPHADGPRFARIRVCFGDGRLASSHIVRFNPLP